MLIKDVLHRNAAIFAERDAIVVPGGRTETWGSLQTRVNRLAATLLTSGLAATDRVAIFSPNSAEAVELHFACASTGVIEAPVNTRLNADDIVSYLSYVKPRGLLVHSELVENASTWISRVPSIEITFGFGGEHPFQDLEQAMAAESEETVEHGISENDLYILAPTSGTTGVPKAVALSNRNAVTSLASWAADHDTREGDTYLPNLPFFFNPGGPAHLHPLILKGGRLVVTRGFDATTFAANIEKYHVTHTIAVPTMLSMVLDAPETAGRDLSSLRSMILGGSPIPVPLLSRATEVFGNIFCPLYALAETFSSGFILRPEAQTDADGSVDESALRSAGRPGVFMSARTVDDDGVDVPHDGETAGELWLKGDSVADGYFSMPEETKQAFTEDGWFKTGDVAVVSADNFFTLVDRKKDVIISGGINVYGRELEETLSRHPAVLELAAVGKPDLKWGESVHIFVVRRPGHELSEEVFLEYARDHLSGFKRPKSASFIEALPRNATGKVLKRELRKALDV